MSPSCPVCQHPLTAMAEQFYCDRCQRAIPAIACCPDCQKPLQVLKACGAVDYFCQHGHGLISKRRLLLLPAGTP